MSELDTILKFSSLPDDLKKEASDFIDVLKSKAKKMKQRQQPREPGVAKGLIEMSDDFDEPLEDFKEYM